jgi:hypothetical protein
VNWLREWFLATKIAARRAPAVTRGPYARFRIARFGIALSPAGSNRTMTFDLVSPLPLAECILRLRAATDSRFAIAGRKPVLGTVRDTTIRLRRRRYYRHGAQCWLSGTFTEDGGRTRLHCTVGIHPLVRTFLEYWVVCIFLGGGWVFVRTLRTYWAAQGPLPESLWLGLVVPPLLLGFGVIMLALSEHSFGDDPRFLIEFVARTIDGKEVWYRGSDTGNQDAHPV